MSGAANCVGCGKRGPEICPACREHAVGNRSIESTRAPLRLAAGSFLLSLAGAVVIAWSGTRRGLYGDRLFWYSVLFAACALFWFLREARRPLGYDLRGDAVVVRYVLGIERWLDFETLRLLPGTLHDGRTGRRYRIGEDRYPGAVELHRALRIRRALAGAPGRDRARPG